MNTPRKEFLLSQQAQNAKTFWNEHVRATFETYMTLPCVSLAYDNAWKENGYIDSAVELYENFAREHVSQNSHVFVQHLENRTPLLVIDVPAHNYEGNDTVLLYGHLDKQPPMTGWNDGVEPFAATYIDERVYGRGGADDGYAMFSALMAIKQSDEAGTARARCVVIIEASEESGSPDLPAHLAELPNSLATDLGDVSLVVCLDSGCLTYDHLWITRSLRGLLQINVSVKVLDEGTHSGGAGGIVPSATHILRALLDRITEPASGKILLEALCTEVSDDVRASAEEAADILKETSAHGLPFADDVHPLHEKVADQIIANTYEPQLEIIGIEGIPSLADAGNVLRPEVTLALSFRLPPRVDPSLAAAAISEKFLTDIPYNAGVSVVVDSMANGWEAPMLSPWFADAVSAASTKHFGDSVHFMGEGGTIPFMAMLGEKYTDAQFMVTGVLGPASNAHGPNEFLDLPTAYKVTACVSDVLTAHGQRTH